MSKTRPRTQEESAEAVRRVVVDGPVPLWQVACLAGVTLESAKRWVIEGCRGVHLDAVKHEGSWYSSAAALVRFIGALLPLDPHILAMAAAVQRAFDRGRAPRPPADVLRPVPGILSEVCA
jgi:hypothetical protein